GQATAGIRPRLNVTAFRLLEGECPPVAERTTSGGTPAAQPKEAAANVAATREAALRGPSPAVPRTVTAAGCLVRQTPAGGALTAQPSDADTFALTRARIEPALDASTVSAVPGSAPSGTGSGT